MTVQIVRASGRTIELHRDCLREDRTGVEQALNEAAPHRQDGALSVIAAVSPGRRFAHRASDDEGKRLRTAESMLSDAQIQRPGVSGPLAIALCGAEDGRPVAPAGHARWLMVGAHQDSLAESQVWLGDFSLRDAITTPAIAGHLGALTMASQLSGAPSSVVLWDLGATHSRLFIVNRKGVLATQPCAVGYAQIFEAIQAELALNSPAAAGKLFLNTFFDFTDTGPKIAKRIAPALRSALVSLGGAPSALFCIGLPAGNNWFARDLSTALGIHAWKPSIAALARELGVDFLGNALAGKLGTGALGLLHLVGAHAAKSDAWRPPWQMLAAPAPGGSKPAAAIAPTTEESDEDDSESSEESDSTTAVSAVEKPLKTPSSPTAVADSRPSVMAHASARATALAKQSLTAAKPPEPLPKQGDKNPAPAAIAPAPGNRTETKALLSGTSSPKPTINTTDLPASGSVATAIRRSAAFAPPPNSGSGTNAIPFPGSGKSKEPIPGLAAPHASAQKRATRKIVAAAAIVVLFVAAGFGWLAFRSHQAQSLALFRQTEAESVATKAVARAKAAEENASREAERVRREVAAERENAIAEAKRKTEEEVMLRVEAERLAHAPGILIVNTEPTGAHVWIDGGLPQAAPLSISSLSIGTHRIAIGLPGYDVATRTVEIKRGQTTDLGLVELTRQYGTIEVISEPAGLAFELRSAAEKPGADPLLTGNTPATIGDLAVGDFTVTLLREGWKSLVTPTTVKSLATSQVIPLFSTARLSIVSTPSGATVSQNGEVIGTTPLTLPELAPGEAAYELTLADHEDGRVKARLVAGADLELSATLDRFDRILKNSEVALPPLAIKRVSPEFVSRGNDRPEKAVLSCVIDRTGVPQSIEVENSSSDAFAKACVAALQEWRFTPAKTKAGKIANVRVTIPFNLAPR